MNAERIAVAVRVLHAVIDRRQPIPADIALLKTWVPTELHHSKPDELARHVINAQLPPTFGITPYANGNQP